MRTNSKRVLPRAQSTNLHPRLALITGTLGFAAGHLLHAMIVALAVMCSFAAIGSWRFGIQRNDFTTFGSALSSEVRLFFSPDPFDKWHTDPDLLLYTLLLLFMMSLLVLNFVLAIIVAQLLKWNFKTTAIVIVMSVVPFGTFWMERTYLEKKLYA